MQKHYKRIDFALFVRYSYYRCGIDIRSNMIQVRVDDDLKTKSDALFKDLGTDTTTAIRMFLTQALAVNGFPFEIKRPNTNPYGVLAEYEILDKLEKLREQAAQGIYKDAAGVSRDMRTKYII